MVIRSIFVTVYVEITGHTLVLAQVVEVWIAGTDAVAHRITR